MASNLTNLQVFEQTLQTAMVESVAQMVDIFNQASNGAIVLRNGSNPGDFNRESLYGLMDATLLRDVYEDEAIASANLDRDVIGGVKLPYGTKAIDVTQALWNHIGRSPSEAGIIVAQTLGPAFAKQKLNLAIAAVAAALQNVGSTVTHDAGDDVISLDALNSGSALFGDRYEAIVAWVMHSTVFHKLLAAGLANATALFTYGTVKIMQDHMGRPLIVTDSPDLIASDSDYITLGLVRGGVVIEENPGFRSVIQTTTGRTNIKDTLQAEGSFNLTLKGFKWDEANGGTCPDEDALAVGTNWDQVVASIKDGPGVVVRTDDA